MIEFDIVSLTLINILLLSIGFLIGSISGKSIKSVRLTFQGSIDRLLKESNFIFLEDDKIKAKGPGDELIIEDEEGDVALFILIKRFKHSDEKTN